MLGILEELKNPILQNNFKEAKELFEKNDKKGIPAHLNRVAIVLNKNEFDDLDRLNHCNIITAPKRIKLSEIMTNLDEGIFVERSKAALFISKPVKHEIEPGYFKYTRDHLLYIQDNKIGNIWLVLDDTTKWLYELYITGTEIIDDLEAKENE